MRTIYRIALIELRTLFYSPVPWVVLVVFAIQAGIKFNDGMDFTNISAQFPKINPGSLTFSVFSDQTFGLLPDVQKNLYLIIPLLTMGLISREISSGSIKLLLSSPIALSYIILGKYLAIMAYGLVVIGMLLIFLIAGGIFITSLDVSLVLSGLIGLYLLLGAYAAIGLFMSCLTSYQVVAAISTLVILGALNYVRTIWQHIDFVRDLTTFLSISGRADQMIKGLIVSKDVMYFLLVITLFVSACIIKLHGERKSSPWWLSLSKYSCLVIMVIFIGFVSSWPSFSFYKDMTRNQDQTLTVKSQEVIKKLDGPLKITSYVNLVDESYGSAQGMPRNRNYDLALFHQYRRFIPHLKMDYVYYYDDPKIKETHLPPVMPSKELITKLASRYKVNEDMFLPPEKIRGIIDLSPEGNTFVRMLEAGGKRTSLRTYSDFGDRGAIGEQEMSSALKRLTTDPPLVAFIQGHEERSIDRSGDGDLQNVFTDLHNRLSLINKGFDVVNTSLNTQKIPSNTTVLVIADPKLPYQEREIKEIHDYLEQGGNLMLLGEPGRQHIINPILQPLGVQMMDGTIVQNSVDHPVDFVMAPITKEISLMDSVFTPFYTNENNLVMPGVSGMRYSDTGAYTIRAIAISDSSKSWNKAGLIDNKFPTTTFDSLAGDRRGSFPTALTLTRRVKGKEQKIILFGDTDFMTVTMLRANSRIPNTCPGMFYFNLFYKWFSNGEFPVGVVRPEHRDTTLSMEFKKVSTAKRILTVGLPILFVCMGTILLIRRKRK